MYIVEVIPITRSVLKDSLSYFSSKALSEGSFVYVQVRKSQVPALVLSCRLAETAKAQIKSLPYTLKKIDSEETQTLFTKSFIESCKKASDYFASHTGLIIETLTPKKILTSLDLIEPTPLPTSPATEQTLPEVYVLQCSDDERYAYYKSLIREYFAKKKSIFICVPTVEDALRLSRTLEKGIEEFTHVFHGSLTTKQMLTEWNATLRDPHALLIIGTGSFLSLPRHDIGVVVIEKESSRTYKTIKRPYIDIRTFAEYYTARSGIRLIMADQVLRVETAWRYRNGELIEAAPIKWRSLTTATASLVDMRQYVITHDITKETKKEFRLLSDEVIELIERTKRESERMYMYVGRRGLSPSVVCNDCGTTVRCLRCHAPVVLHGGITDKENEENFFLCHRCGLRRSAFERCATCSSWNLITLGIGAEKVERYLKEKFPDITFFKIDYDTVKSHKQAEDIVNAFYATPGSIMIGTEMALLYLHEKIEQAAVISMDSLFSIPDFRMNEKILGTLLKIRSLTYKGIIIQTRQPEQTIWDYALKGNLIDFYREEITERERFGYPPFTTLIKISFEGKREDVVRAMKDLKTFLDPWKVVLFPAFIETSDHHYVLHGLIKLPAHQWVDPDLLAKLRSLPPAYTIKIDPEHLL